MALAFFGARPQGRMISSISLIESWIILEGVLALAKSFGVIVLTRASVHWAESRTAIRRV